MPLYKVSRRASLPWNWVVDEQIIELVHKIIHAFVPVLVPIV